DTSPPGEGPLVSKVSISNGTVVESGVGIYLQKADDCTLRKLEIRGNTTNISLVNSNRNTIIDSVISKSVDEGIQLENSHSNHLSGNKVTESNQGTGGVPSGGAAIRLRESNRNIIEFNDVLRNVREGVQLAAAGVSPGVKGSFKNTILNNRIIHNGELGIAVGAGSDDNTIVGNDVEENQSEGRIGINSSRKVAEHNSANEK